MSDTMPRVALPLLAVAQAQKHVTHNEALLELDALLATVVLDRDLSTPLSSPSDGDTYLVKAAEGGGVNLRSRRARKLLQDMQFRLAESTGKLV